MDTRQVGTALAMTGLILIGLNFLALAPFVAGQVEAGVADQVAGGYDELDDYGEDWLVSSADRSYFAYTISNVEDISDISEAQFERVGPFIYNVTTTREILDFDADAGTITYSEFDSFAWCEDCVHVDADGNEHASLPGSTNISQVNILWNTQRIAGISTGIIYGEIFAKAGFANNMMANDLTNKAPSMWAAEEIAATVDGAAAQLEAAGYDAATAAAMAPIVVMDGAYDSWNASAGGVGPMDPDFSSSAASILYDAVDPSTGTCIALTCDIGPMLAAGIGEPSAATTPVRAALYGYDASDSLTDWAVYAMAGSKFLAHGGGADLTEVTDLRERLNAVSGVDIANAQALNNVVFGVPDAAIPNGLLSLSDYNGIPLNGVALFLLGAQGDAFGTMVQYGIGLTQLLGLADYAGGWIGMVGVPFEFPMILAGGSGMMNADLWWQTSWAGEEPIGGGYIPIGLNRGEFTGTVDLTPADARRILYDHPSSLTSDFARVFMYAELTGELLPSSESGDLAEGGVVQTWDNAMVANMYGITEGEAAALRSWVNDFMFGEVIGALLGFQYGGSPFLTQPVENWLFGWRDVIVADVVYGEIDNMDVGWVSLETNETYFGSNSVSTGDFDVYVMSTGTGEHADDGSVGQRLLSGYINSNGDGLCDFKLNADGTMANPDSDGYYPCQEGELYGFTEYLPWRAPHRETSTLGLLSDHVGNNDGMVAGAIGGVASADDSFRVNLAGYAMAQSVPGDMEDYKGIPMRSHSITLDPSQNQIQAKLIGSGTFVDVIPGALPVYFGSSVEIKVEPTTNVAMYGKSVSMFHLDLRGPGMMNPDFSAGSDDTHPVFEIHTFSEIPDDSAEIFQCKVLDNMEPMYWTDFGGQGDCALDGTGTIDIVTAVLYVASVGFIAAGAWMMTAAAGAGGSLLTSSDEEE